MHGSERHALWPDVPTSKEQGYPLELMLDMIFCFPPGNAPEQAGLLRDGTFYGRSSRQKSFVCRPVIERQREKAVAEIRGGLQ
jgi:hypothetical protein